MKPVCFGPFEALTKVNDSNEKVTVLTNRYFNAVASKDGKDYRITVYDYVGNIEYGVIIGSKSMWEEKYSFILNEWFPDIKDEAYEGDYEKYWKLALDI